MGYTVFIIFFWNTVHNLIKHRKEHLVHLFIATSSCHKYVFFFFHLRSLLMGILLSLCEFFTMWPEINKVRGVKYVLFRQNYVYTVSILFVLACYLWKKIKLRTSYFNYYLNILLFMWHPYKHKNDISYLKMESQCSLHQHLFVFVAFKIPTQM